MFGIAVQSALVVPEKNGQPIRAVIVKPKKQLGKLLQLQKNQKKKLRQQKQQIQNLRQQLQCQQQQHCELKEEMQQLKMTIKQQEKPKQKSTEQQGRPCPFAQSSKPCPCMSKNQAQNQTQNQTQNQMQKQMQKQMEKQMQNQMLNQLQNQMQNQMLNQMQNQMQNPMQNQMQNPMQNQMQNYDLNFNRGASDKIPGNGNWQLQNMGNYPANSSSGMGQMYTMEPQTDYYKKTPKPSVNSMLQPCVAFIMPAKAHKHKRRVQC